MILGALLDIIPDHWARATLETGAEKDLQGVEHEAGFWVSIYNSEEPNDICVPSENLYVLIQKHLQIFRDRGSVWRKLTFEVAFDEAKGDWVFSIDYAY